MASGELQQAIVLRDFAGGYADPESVSLLSIPPNQSPLMRNIDTSGGSARTMQGFIKAHANAKTTNITGGWYDHETDRTYFAYNGRLGKLDLDPGVLNDIAGTNLFTTGKFTGMARLVDKIMVVNGFDAPRLFDPVAGTCVAIATPPADWGPNNQPYLVVNWMGRLFAAVKSKPDILYFSKLYDPTDWTPGTNPTDGGAIRIGEDGKRINALYPFNETLAVFKDLGLYAMDGNAKFNTSTLIPEFDQTTFDWKLIYPGVDATSQYGLVPAYDELYVWGRTQVWRISTKDISNRIQADPISAPDIAATVQKVQTDLDQITGVFYPERNQVWFNVKRTGASARFDVAYCYDLKNKKWMIRDGYSHALLINAFEAGKQVIYGCGYADAGSSYVYRHNVGYTYDSVPVPWYYYTAWLPLGQANRGRTNRVSFLFGAGTVDGIGYSYAYDTAYSAYDTASLSADGATSTWNTGGGSTWGTGGGTTGTWQTRPSARVVQKIFGRGLTIQHRFSGSGFFELLELSHSVSTTGYS